MPGQVLAEDMRGPLAQDAPAARRQRHREARLYSALKAPGRAPGVPICMHLTNYGVTRLLLPKQAQP